MIHILSIIAQTTTRAAPQQQPNFLKSFLPILAAIGVLYFFMFRGGQKDKKRLQKMLADLKRNDRIQTIGGVRGTVVDVRDDEVVIKVDESSNVRMRFARSAIKEVFTNGSAADAKK
jgi:preprotein translocase subunit YajC